VGSILLVQSDPDTRDRLGGILRDARHEVLFAVNSQDALLRLREGGIDVVVIDSYDPRVGVVELARSMDNLPDVPPIVLISRSPYAPEISARIGAASFLPKPLDVMELTTLVERLAGGLRPVKTIDDEEPTGPARVSARPL
jgi:DNA-binding NtrC family response regulator